MPSNYNSILEIPNGIDLHVHFRQPGLTHKETIATGLEAAKSGGISSVFDMPNTKPPTDTKQALKEKLEYSRKYEGYYPIAGFTNRSVENNTLSSLANQAGILKVFMANSTGKLGINRENFVKGIEQLSEIPVIVMIHAEDPELITPRFEGCDENEVRPPQAEINAIKFILEVAQDFPETKFHITHVSTGTAGDILERQNQISWDVLPKHLVFTNSLVNEMGNLARMNPPLRPNEEQKKLYELFKQGKIPIITSDHAPHTIQEKQKLIAGAPGVQELYPFLLDQYLRGKITKIQMEDMIYTNPLKLLHSVGIKPIKEKITVDTSKSIKFTKNQIKSKSKWSLWEGYRFQGDLLG